MRRATKLPLLVLALLAGTGAYAADQRPGPGPRLFVSPAGKVYRPGGEADPIETWFREADSDHDGALGYEEFRADFARTFAEFDTDHDGEIEPEEVTHYETVTLPEMAGHGGFDRRTVNRGRAPGGGLRRGGFAGMSGAARFGLIPISHPIMDADEDFNRGVTRAEFERAAARRFNLLDSAHDGRLSLADLLAHRQPPPR